jgi:hypothetical protein
MRFMAASVLSLFLSVGIFAGSARGAAEALPPCRAHGQTLQLNNEQVLDWRNSTPNQFRNRGLVSGPVTRIFLDAGDGDHVHFEIQIGPEKDDVIEVVFNSEFGNLPDQIELDMPVTACGDYITSNAPTKQYPASPSGALIHWLHFDPDNHHDDGWMVIGGKVYGMEGQGQKGHKKPKH